MLSQAIESSRGSVREMMEEFKLSTLEQRNMIFEVFDRVSRLQVREGFRFRLRLMIPDVRVWW